jgi:hypothetical protein
MHPLGFYYKNQRVYLLILLQFTLLTAANYINAHYIFLVFPHCSPNTSLKALANTQIYQGLQSKTQFSVVVALRHKLS